MIIVTGSGRSGTSIVTKILNLAGFDIGKLNDWDDRWRAGLEHPEVVELNKVMFGLNRKGEYYGKDWLVPAEIDKCATLLKKVLQHYGNKTKGMVIKDPLFSKTLEVWIKAGVDIEHVIVCKRDAYISAKSANETSKGFSPVSKYRLDDIFSEMLAREGRLHQLNNDYSEIPFSYVQYENLEEDLNDLLKDITELPLEKIDEILSDNIKMSVRK